MMASQVLEFKDSPERQKPKYLEDKALFFLQIKKVHSFQIKGYIMVKNSFPVDMLLTTE